MLLLFVRLQSPPTNSGTCSEGAAELGNGGKPERVEIISFILEAILREFRPKVKLDGAFAGSVVGSRVMIPGNKPRPVRCIICSRGRAKFLPRPGVRAEANP